MGLFNNSKELPEIDRIMENIAQIEGDMQKKFSQLGQIYYENNKNFPNLEHPYYELISQINQLSENKKNLYKSKLRLEGKMMCENCGKLNPFGSRFCNYCGKLAAERQENSFAAEITSNYKTCNQCGTKLDASDVFCFKCGNNVEE